jgi:two-component system sensor histidine kinase HydH
VWQQEFLEELKVYMGFTAAHASTLRELGPAVASGFPRIVERFYSAIRESPRAMAVFTGGAAQIERQKSFLHDWLGGVVSGTYDVEYVRLRERIGRTHVRIRLEQRYMFGAMNTVRQGLHEELEASSYPQEKRALGHEAIDKICDLELAIMLETYAEDSTVRLRDQERLATLGQLSGFIGHELRNPLAVMETSLHLLKQRVPADDANVTRHMRRLGEQVALATGIISDLLELARDRPIARAATALPALVAAVVEDLPGNDECAIEQRVPDSLPGAHVDGPQVRYLLTNLIANACQALVESTHERRVVVSAEAEGDTLLLCVDDSGPGIADELRHRLFEPLATTRQKGLGLGLALCRRIAEKHGGDIRALKSPLGGARFEARFPQAFAAPQTGGTTP